jgi:ketosteroid isomerase-like protein
MSQENVDIVRRSVEAFLAGDIESALSYLHPEVQWHGTIGGLDEGRIHRGHDAVIASFAENLASWEQLTLEPEDYIEAGDSVVVLWHEVAKSRHSEVEMETRTAVVYTLRDGLVVEVQGYMDRDAAFASLGIEPPGA